MRSPDDPGCKYSLSLSHEELDSLRWLLEVVNKVAQNPKSKNQQKAALAEITIEKMRDSLLDLHAEIHLANERVAEAAMSVAFDNMAAAVALSASAKDGSN